ncbi:unnamed protein product [Calypogeia fissa]
MPLDGKTRLIGGIEGLPTWTRTPTRAPPAVESSHKYDFLGEYRNLSEDDFTGGTLESSENDSGGNRYLLKMAMPRPGCVSSEAAVRERLTEARRLVPNLCCVGHRNRLGELPPSDYIMILFFSSHLGGNVYTVCIKAGLTSKARVNT